MIKDEEGEIQNTHKDIEAVLVQHFWNIIRENIPDRDQTIRGITRHIPKLVSKEDNFNLNRPVTEEEVSKDSAQTTDKYRPIVLCNVVYKIISKVVANRLKPLLPSLVSKEQSGFVEGRQILNNIIQAHEVVHTLTSKRQAGMIMQLDIAKAYDKVNWIYIKKVLSTFGFDHNWVRWVMALVTSSSFSILVNISPSEIFDPSRGLRKGDPLSPFLFILMMEGLGQSIKQAKAMGKIRGLQVSENVSTLTHQQFFDDTLLQGIPTVKEASAYNQILKDFSMATGQSQKMDLLCLEPDKQVSSDKGSSTIYPVFMLSALPAPKGVLKQFKNIQRDFLWGKEETRKKLALVSWEKICKPKSHGGLGLDDQEILSKVLGAKLWWRWVQEPKSHWARIWKKKYASSWHTNDLIRMSRIIKGSYIWNRAWENRSLVQKNSFWEIRAGDLALFWEDKWQQEPTLLTENFVSLKQETDAQGLIKVKDFWDLTHISGKWRSWRNIDCREDNPLKIKAEALGGLLKQRMILVTKGQDQLRWGNNKKGTFNLKEAKGFLLGLGSSVPDKTWQHLWRHQGWMKIKLFMWLVHHKENLTWDNIRKRGVMGPSICQLCEE
eukprot:PITA_22800